jgi:PhoH-like ATPase
MKKNFVLDTNVLLHDANALFAFDDNTVCLPIYVIEEIDNFKRDMNELGRNARETVRLLDQLRSQGNLRDGVPIPSGGQLRVIFAEKVNGAGNGGAAGQGLDAKIVDNRILAAALQLDERERDEAKTVFITKDINLRIRADARGLQAEDYDKEQIDISEVYTGFRELEVADSLLASFFEAGEVELPGAELHANEFVALLPPGGGEPTHARFHAERGVLMPIVDTRRRKVYGVRARNAEQMFALDLLLDDDIKLVTLVGKAGTGKTLLALAAGLQKVNDDGGYSKLLVSRPVIPLGKDIGYLPGEVEDKMNPWMKPVYDNIELLTSLNTYASEGRGTEGRAPTGRGGQGDFSAERLVDVEPLTYLRGRSIPNQYLIIDEAQNLTPHEVKTVITRAGVGTKIVLTGDPYQIDNPYLDSVNNGLTTLVQKFRGQAIAGTMTLVKGERSELAEIASNLL